jgi:putative PIN family toxin of toxin-antitoxin system
VRVVFDTNVLISALVYGGLPRELLSRVFRGEITLVTSTVLMNELEEVLVARFAHDPSLARTVRAEIELLAEVVDATELARVARDPGDDAVLAVAIAGEASAIVTGDRDLLVLAEHHGIRVVTPRDFASSSGR